MTSLHTQIKKAYEEEGLSPEQIASVDVCGLEVTAVKAALMQCSALYRKDCGHEEEGKSELNLSHDQQKQIIDELFRLAMSTDDEHLKGKLLLNLRDDGKGRKDIVKNVQHSGGNILMLNQFLSQAKEGAQEAMKRLKAVNV